MSLPTEEAARIALRTQQVVAFESGVTDTVDPLAGSYFVEALTNEVEQKAWELIS
ncbi:MAG: methylmalonyl-CoA mutase family protein [Chitinophagaceae bacterium]